MTSIQAISPSCGTHPGLLQHLCVDSVQYIYEEKTNRNSHPRRQNYGPRRLPVAPFLHVRPQECDRSSQQEPFLELETAEKQSAIELLLR
jgi:hypothetical protein